MTAPFLVLDARGAPLARDVPCRLTTARQPEPWQAPGLPAANESYTHVLMARRDEPSLRAGHMAQDGAQRRYLVLRRQEVSAALSPWHEYWQVRAEPRGLPRFVVGHPVWGAVWADAVWMV